MGFFFSFLFFFLFLLNNLLLEHVNYVQLLSVKYLGFLPRLQIAVDSSRRMICINSQDAAWMCSAPVMEAGFQVFII